MHEDLSNVLGANVAVLDLLRHDVLALGQLEDVLLAVDDFQSSVLQNNRSNHIKVHTKPLSSYGLPHADVSGVVPAFFVDGLVGAFGVLVVALEHVGAFHADFALVIPGPVLHFRDVDELDAAAAHGRTHVSRDVVTLDC